MSEQPQPERKTAGLPAETPASQARDGAVMLLLCGVIAAGVGAAIAAANNPGTEPGLLGDTVDTGNKTVYVIGLIVAGLGSVAMWIGIIALGVLLGVKAARR